MKKSNQAFTLVELIVVITILAILGTIAFISLQGYSKDTRNSVRLSDLSNINKMLGIRIVESGKVLLPDNYVEITASGTILTYQGEAGENVLNALGVSNGGKDPKDETYYTYSTNTTRTKYQLLGFLEGDALANNTILGKANAVTDLTERQIKVKGQELGIILDSVTNIPVTTNVDVVNTTDTYKVTFSENDLVEGTGATLFLAFYSKHKELAEMDDSLVGYWDMETMSGSLLKDLSGNGNDGECYNSGTLVDCGSASGPQFTNKGIDFDGIDDWIKVRDDDSLDFGITSDFTFSVWINSRGSSDSQGILAKRGGLGQYFLAFSTSKQGVYYLNDGINISYASAYYVNSLDNWDNLTTVFDRDGESWFYINGEKINSFDISSIGDINNNSYLEIGSANSAINSSHKKFNGYLNEIKIYNRALSDLEVQTIYNSTK